MKFHPKPEPKLGDTRSRIKFALFPKKLEHNGDVVTVWLEDYYVREEYQEYVKTVGIMIPCAGVFHGWVVVESHPMEAHYS